MGKWRLSGHSFAIGIHKSQPTRYAWTSSLPNVYKTQRKIEREIRMTISSFCRWSSDLGAAWVWEIPRHCSTTTVDTAAANFWTRNILAYFWRRWTWRENLDVSHIRGVKTYEVWYVPTKCTEEHYQKLLLMGTSVAMAPKRHVSQKKTISDTRISTHERYQNQEALLCPCEFPPAGFNGSTRKCTDRVSHKFWPQNLWLCAHKNTDLGSRAPSWTKICVQHRLWKWNPRLKSCFIHFKNV